MVGPFMQGIFLLGIIYWYSKGMMSLINDYYRSEFHRKLKTSDHSEATMDDFAGLLSVDDHEHNSIQSNPELGAAVEKRYQMLSSVCYKSADVVFFMELVMAFERNPNSEFCWLDTGHVDSSS